MTKHDSGETWTAAWNVALALVRFGTVWIVKALVSEMPFLPPGPVPDGRKDAGTSLLVVKTTHETLPRYRSPAG